MADLPPLVLATQKLAGLSGKVVLVLENARRLGAMGWPVEVIAQELDRRPFAEAGVRAFRVSRPPIGRAGRLRWFSRHAVRRARRAGALLVGHGESLFEQDVLHVHNCVHRTHEETHGAPLEGSAQGVAAAAQARILSERRFLHVVANSRLTRDDLVERYAIAPESITVVYPGHDPERFRAEPRPASAEALRRRLGVPDGGVLVGLVTSGDFEKRGVAPFLRAVAMLPPALTASLSILVAGKESRLERYESLAAETGLGARVHFLPPRPDVEVVYQALDLYVHPAHFEEFGMSVLEAMACGVPVLTSGKVGASELYAGPARDELLDDLAPGTLRDGLARLLAEPARRRALGEAGRAAAREHTWESNAAAHARCYERVWAERRASPAL